VNQWYPTTLLHGVTTQKTMTWIFITLKTSNLEWETLLVSNIILQIYLQSY
jgi:hypothetical protein